MDMRAKKRLLPVFLILICGQFLLAEDYQYQYFKDEKKEKVPFSDYIPKVRLHYKTVPHYLEDYYELYGMKQYWDENSLRVNIEKLKAGLNSKFRHPSLALVKIGSDEEFLKYRNLLFMHINLLIMRNYLSIASKYDKRKIEFHNVDFAEDIKKSLDVAELYYKDALPYWEQTKNYASIASAVKITTDLGFMESERYSIIRGELDYGKIINNYIKDIALKKNKLDELAAVKK